MRTFDELQAGLGAALPLNTPGSTAEHVLADAGQALLHRAGNGSVVLDPGALPFPVVLTDSLLDGDPRARRVNA